MKSLTDEELANLKHLLRAVQGRASDLGHSSKMLIEAHGDGEALYLGRGEPMIDADGKPIGSALFPGLDIGAHGLNIVHLVEPAYQWPDVRAFIFAACNSIEPLLDMLVEAQAHRGSAHEPMLRAIAFALKGPRGADEWGDLVKVTEDTRAALVTALSDLRSLKHSLEVTGVPVARAKVLIELWGDPQQLSKHADALMRGITEYGNYKYLPDEHHKNCPFGPPQVDEETGETFQNACRCGYAAFHALKDVIRIAPPPPPQPIITQCPRCTAQHVDEGEWATRPHRTHRCVMCEHEWRPMNVPTVGVRELPPDET